MHSCAVAVSLASPGRLNSEVAVARPVRPLYQHAHALQKYKNIGIYNLIILRYMPRPRRNYYYVFFTSSSRHRHRRRRSSSRWLRAECSARVLDERDGEERGGPSSTMRWNDARENSSTLYYNGKNRRKEREVRYNCND